MPKTAKTPGSVLQSLIDEYGQTPAAVARDIKVKNLGGVLAGKDEINLDLALRLSRYFNNTVEFWIKTQLAFYKKTLAAEIKSIPKAKKPAPVKKGRPGRKPAADKKSAADKKPGRGRGRKPAADKAPAKVKAPRAPRGSKKAALAVEANLGPGPV